MNKSHSKARRLREHLLVIAVRADLRCWVCGERLAVDSLMSGSAKDGILWHHRDGDRTNDSPDNLVPVHRCCHTRYERSMAEKDVDIRLELAVTVCGPSPTDYKSTRTRRGGSMRPGLLAWVAANRPDALSAPAAGPEQTEGGLT